MKRRYISRNATGLGPVKTFYLQTATRASLLGLVGKTNDHITADSWEAVIAFDDVTVRCSLRDESAASQNKHDEIIVTSIEVRPGKIPSPAEARRELSGQRLTGVLVADSIVFFTDHVTYGSPYRVLQGTQSLFSRVRAALVGSDEQRLKALVDRMLVDAQGGHTEITMSPLSDAWRSVDPQFVNHVETGILFRFGDLCLPAFTADNGFAMVCTKERPLWPLDEVVSAYEGACRFTTLSLGPPGL